MPIRDAQATDADPIARLHLELWRETYGGVLPKEALRSFSHEERRRFWSAWLTAGTAAPTVLVATDAAGVVRGFAAGGPQRSADPTFDAEVYALHVGSGAERGTERVLLAALAERLAERKLVALLVWTLPLDPARALYESTGARPVRVRRVETAGVVLEEVAFGWPPEARPDAPR